MKTVINRVMILLFGLFVMFTSNQSSYADTIVLNEQDNYVWLGDGFGSDNQPLEWSWNFDLPGLDIDEMVKVSISHYGAYPSTPRDTVWINGNWLFDLGQSSNGSWGYQDYSFYASAVNLSKSHNTITVYSEGFDSISEWGLDDILIGDLAVDYSVKPVPEPSSVLLLCAGLVGLAGAKKKFNR